MKRTLIGLVAIIIIVLAAAIAFHRSHMHVAAPANQPFSSEKVNVSTFDAKNVSSIAGFPADLPIETANVTEQNKLDYPDRGATLYSLSYTSAKSLNALGRLYSQYLASHGYSLEKVSTTTPTYISFQSDKGSDSISVVVTPAASGSLVQLGVVHRIVE